MAPPRAVYPQFRGPFRVRLRTPVLTVFEALTAGNFQMLADFYAGHPQKRYKYLHRDWVVLDDQGFYCAIIKTGDQHLYDYVPTKTTET